MLLNCGAGEHSWETANRSNQSILKEISPEYSLEGLILKLKLQYFGHLMWRADSLENTLRLGKIEDRRRRGYQRMRWLNGTTNSMDINLGKLREMMRDTDVRRIAVHGVTKSWTQLGAWTTTTYILKASRVAQRLKNPLASEGNTGDSGSISWSGRSPGGGNGNPRQYSGL